MARGKKKSEKDFAKWLAGLEKRHAEYKRGWDEWEKKHPGPQVYAVCRIDVLTGKPLYPELYQKRQEPPTRCKCPRCGNEH